MTAIAPTIGRIANPYLDLETYDPAADVMVMNLGPQHPSTHGVFRLKLYLDGETIVKAVPYCGYLHRGVEKLCEKLTYANITPIFDKNDYVAPMTSEQAVNMAFEKLLAVEVPRRARYIRTILAELQRVASHLLWLATFGMDLGGALGGGTSIFMHCFRERESILDLFEALTGCRFHYNTHTVGGQRHDIPADWAKLVHPVIDHIEQRTKEYEAILDHPIVHRRTKGVGVIDGELALEVGLTGPNLRASGVDHDLRRDAPFHVYDELDINVFTHPDGDCWGRYRVRLLELREAIRLVRLLIDNVPEGPIVAQRPVKLVGQIRIKAGHAYVGIETPRGELGTYVIAGGANKFASPYRLKIRPPSLHALSVLPYILPGHTVSDAVAILGSVDPIMGEADR